MSDDSIIIDEVAYPNYIEKEPIPNRLSKQFLENYIKIIPNDYTKILKYWEIVCKVKDKNEYIKGVIIKKIEEDNQLFYILKNESYRYIWAINVIEYDIYIKNHEKIYSFVFI